MKEEKDFYHFVGNMLRINLSKQDTPKLDNDDVSKLGYIKISDEEIIEKANHNYVIEDEIEAFIQGCKWYKEELSKRY